MQALLYGYPYVRFAHEGPSWSVQGNRWRNGGMSQLSYMIKTYAIVNANARLVTVARLSSPRTTSLHRSEGSDGLVTPCMHDLSGSRQSFGRD